MAKFLFEKCCYLLDLRIGSFILGYMEMIIFVVMSILLVIVMADHRISDDIDKKKQFREIFIFSWLIAHLVLSCGGIAFSVALLLGLHKDISDNVKNYLIYSVFLIVCCIVLLILYMINLAFNIIDFVVSVAEILLKAYVFMFVRSYYYEMIEEEE